MAGTTSNRSWPYPESSDFVADGATAIENLADAIDGSIGTGYAYVQSIYYTSSGTFTKATYPWLRAIRVRVQGAGGGGGNAEETGASESSEAGGGGGGGYAEKFITDITGLSASETISVGAGGAGGSTTAGAGSAGGNTTALGMTGDGGGGGGGMAATGGYSFSGRGVGGFGSGGDVIVRGSDGIMGVIMGYGLASMNNGGGGSHLAGARITGPSSNTQGADGWAYGGGAAGGRNRGQNSGSDKNGGDGGEGIVILELYA